MISLEILRIGEGFTFSVSVDGVVVVGCEVVVVGLLDFRVMVLELDSSFG